MFCGNTLNKPRDDGVAARVTNLQFLRSESQRLPDIGPLAKLRTLNPKKWNRKFETRRHHTDDGEGATVRDDLTSDNLRIGIEPALPQPFADDEDVVVSSGAIGRLEGASANGRHAKNVKQIRRTDGAENAFRTISAGKIEPRRLKHRHLFETAAARLIIDEFRRGNRDGVEMLRTKVFQHQNDVPRSVVRQRTNQQRINGT